jgi:hypothetical protein
MRKKSAKKSAMQKPDREGGRRKNAEVRNNDGEQTSSAGIHIQATTASSNEQATTTGRRKTDIFARENRGTLLDVLVFILNVFLMRLLTRFFRDAFQQASDENTLAILTLGFACLGMFVLAPTGAVLKRWHYHRRLDARAETDDSAKTVLWGCLCNPIFYFCINLVVMSAVMTIFCGLIFGKAFEKNGAIFVTSVITGLLITIVQTYLIYRYFSPPKSAPKSEFLRDPRSETLGDICIFLNVILFQVGWNLITFTPFGRVSGLFDFAGRLFFLSFVALLIYFPPRIFYLAEDIKRPRVWLTMLLANSPVILRVLFGEGSNTLTI